MELGTAGGLLGHVLLVIGPPLRIDANSDEGRYLESVWPEGGVKEIFKVRSLESARGRTGVYEGDIYLYCERKSRKVVLLGEFSDAQFDISREQIELWQCPEELRKHLTAEILSATKDELIAECASWSWTTAIRAVTRTGELDGGFGGSAPSTKAEKRTLLSDIKRCWSNDPICTSIVIGFWQRCLCRIAEKEKLERADLIVQWFPLYCDRCLPGLLLKTMKDNGWRKRETVPMKRASPATSMPTIHSGEYFLPPIEQYETTPNRRAEAALLGPVEPVRYCHLHGTTEKRVKIDPRLRQCQHCNRHVQTNYADFTLCPPCSEITDQCMICGGAAELQARGFVALAPQEMQPQPVAIPVHMEERPACGTPVRGGNAHLERSSTNTPPMHVRTEHPGNVSVALTFDGSGSTVFQQQQLDATPPGMDASVMFPLPDPPQSNGLAKFCGRHGAPERRQKGHAQTKECQACRTMVQTNHINFVFCPDCSDAQNKCMCCGDGCAAPLGHLQTVMNDGFVDQPPILVREASVSFQASHQNAVGNARAYDGSVALPLAAMVNAREVPPHMHQPLVAACPSGSPLARDMVGPPEQPPLLRESSAVLPVPPPGNQLAHAKYCGFHCSGSRMKGEPQTRECKVCHTMITTNYTECSLCPDCSHTQNRCLICGGASQDATPMHNATPMHGQATPFAMGGQMDPRFFVATPAVGPRGTANAAPIKPAQPMGGETGAHPAPPEQSPHHSQLPPQVPPRFCCMHDDSIKRVKAVPSHRQCADCGRAVQTNYQEFTLCAWCSDTNDRCMLCGNNASSLGNAGPYVRNSIGPEANGGGPFVGRRLH